MFVAFLKKLIYEKADLKWGFPVYSSERVNPGQPGDTKLPAPNLGVEGLPNDKEVFKK